MCAALGLKGHSWAVIVMTPGRVLVLAASQRQDLQVPGGQ